MFRELEARPILPISEPVEQMLQRNLENQPAQVYSKNPSLKSGRRFNGSGQFPTVMSVFRKTLDYLNTVEYNSPMTAAAIPAAILVRVSTSKQETDRQVSELVSYAESKGYNVVEICKEEVSGAAAEDLRHGLHRIEELARSGAIKKVLVHEVSRLARKNSVAHAFVETLEELGVSLYWHQQGIETLLPNRKRNPAAGVMFALLAEMARAERETLSERIRSGLAEARRKGRRLGRPQGSTQTDSEFLSKHRDVCRWLKDGQSIRNTAKITGKGVSTVQRVKAAIAS